VAARGVVAARVQKTKQASASESESEKGKDDEAMY